MPFSAGRPETMCGAGSMVANTTAVRAWLPGLLKDLGVKVLLDAPCGDFNWMAHTDLSGVEYIGVDYDGEHLARSNDRSSVPSSYEPRSKRLIELDIATDPLPRADLMLCREFLQHLPNGMIDDVLANFVDSGINWILATSHDNSVNIDVASAGMFRPLNLRAAPFNLPGARRSVDDQPGSGRILGLWHRSDIR